MRIELNDPLPYPVWVTADSPLQGDVYYRATLPARVVGGKITRELLLGRDGRKFAPTQVTQGERVPLGEHIAVAGHGNPTIFRAKELVHYEPARDFVSALESAGADVRVEWDDLVCDKGGMRHIFERWFDIEPPEVIANRFGLREQAEILFREREAEIEQRLIESVQSRMGLSVWAAKAYLDMHGGAKQITMEAVEKQAGPLFRKTIEDFYNDSSHDPVRTVWATRRHVVSTVTMSQEIDSRGPYGMDIRIAPNAIDPWDFRSPGRSAGVVRVGYAGTFGHAQDALVALPALLECASLPGVELHFFGWHPNMESDARARVNYLDMGKVMKHEYGGIRYYWHGGFENVREYYTNIGILDVAVAPLMDTPFNHCKSPQSSSSTRCIRPPWWFPTLVHMTNMSSMA